MIRSLHALILFSVVCFSGTPTFAQSGLASFEQGELEIVTQSGDVHRFDVELAIDPKQQSQGLMFRQRMAADSGMLFIYKPARDVVMWMRNTFLPLDMLFIKSNGFIVRIAERTVPQSTTRIPAGQKVTGVLELNGGTASRLGIKPGDQVRHSAF